jgi:hypothetical protein
MESHSTNRQRAMIMNNPNYINHLKHHKLLLQQQQLQKQLRQEQGQQRQGKGVKVCANPSCMRAQQGDEKWIKCKGKNCRKYFCDRCFNQKSSHENLCEKVR